MNSLEEQLSGLSLAIFEESMTEETDFGKILQRLSEGADPVTMTLQWDEGERQSLILHACHGDDIVLFDPTWSLVEKGLAKLALGSDESSDQQSGKVLVPKDTVASWFEERGAVCLISETASS